MKWLLPIALTVAFSTMCVGQDLSKLYDACFNKADTQSQLKACASEEALRADADLKAIYQQLLSQAANDSKRLEKIVAAERAWAAYRDAYLEALYPAADKLANYGSLYPMESRVIRASLTRQHIQALRTILNPGSLRR